jgi:hypothetical protein
MELVGFSDSGIIVRVSGVIRWWLMMAVGMQQQGYGGDHLFVDCYHDKCTLFTTKIKHFINF